MAGMLLAGAVDSNDSFNSNLLIEPGQDLSSYPGGSSAAAGPSSVAGNGGGSGGHAPLPPHHLPPGAGFPPGSAANPGGYMVPTRKKTPNIWPSFMSHQVKNLEQMAINVCRLFRVTTENERHTHTLLRLN